MIKYTKNLFNIINTLIANTTILINRLANNNFIKVILFLTIISTMFIIIGKIISLSFMETEKDREQKIIERNERILNGMKNLKNYIILWRKEDLKNEYYNKTYDKYNKRDNF